MGCKKTTIAIAKRVGNELGAVLMRKAVTMVSAVESASLADPVWWDDAAKRKVVFDYLKQEAKSAGKDVKGRTISLAIEFAVEAVKGPDDESTIGVDDLATPESV